MAYLSELLSGLTVTLELTVLSLLLGGLLALVLTWTLDRRVPMASQLVEVFLVCFTGTFPHASAKNLCLKGPWMRYRVAKFWLARHWA